MRREEKKAPPISGERGRNLPWRDEDEESLLDLLEALPDALIIVGQDGTLEYLNAQAEQLFGYRKEELVGQPVEVLLPESVRALHIAHRRGYFQDPRVRPMGRGKQNQDQDQDQDLELFGRRKDGQEFPIDVMLSPWRTKRGLFVLATIRDLSPRRKMEEELKKLSNAVEQTADHVFITDKEGIIEYVNPSFERNTGYTKEEAIGKTPRILKSGKHPPEFYEKLWETILKGQVFRAVFVNRRKDGSLYYEEKTITPLRDRQGRITHFVSTGRDITPQVRQQEALKNYQRRLLNLYQLGQELAKIDDLDELCRWAVEQLREHFGYEDAGILLGENGRLRVQAHTHRRREGRCREGEPIPRGGPAYWVWKHRRPLRIDDVTRPPWRLKIADTRSWLLAPIQLSEEIFGVIVLQSEKPAAFASEDEGFLTALAGQLAIAISNIRRRQELQRSAVEMAAALARIIERRDDYTGRHCERLVDLSLRIGRRFGLPPERLEQLRYAALLHDIGKIAIPDHILHKPTRLSVQEWQYIERHPEIGAELVGKITHLRLAAEIIAQHQERYDGFGYPKGLKGEEILLEARILAAVDAWDAMRSDRPYRKALSHTEAIAELKKNAGTQLDPNVVEALLEVLQDQERGRNPNHNHNHNHDSNSNQKEEQSS